MKETYQLSILTIRSSFVCLFFLSSFRYKLPIIFVVINNGGIAFGLDEDGFEASRTDTDPTLRSSVYYWTFCLSPSRFEFYSVKLLTFCVILEKKAANGVKSLCSTCFPKVLSFRTLLCCRESNSLFETCWCSFSGVGLLGGIVLFQFDDDWCHILHICKASVRSYLAWWPLANLKKIQHRHPADWSHHVAVRWSDQRNVAKWKCRRFLSNGSLSAARMSIISSII